MIASLGHTSIDEILDAFNDAFSGYEVKMEMTKEKLQEMMATRSFHFGHSLGFFVDGLLAGFLLIGFRTIQGRRSFYDVATGVRKGHQGKGIGDALVRKIQRAMAENDVDEFILEVLENNIAAQNLYKKCGFRVTRKLNCYEYSGEGACLDSCEGKEASPETDFIRQIPVNDYCSFIPSWQNALASYENVKEKYNLVYEFENEVLIGYGIVHRQNGSIMQLGIHPGKRSAAAMTRVMGKLRRKTEGQILRYLNVEENCAVEGLLKQIGFKNSVNQFEMRLQK